MRITHLKSLTIFTVNEILHQWLGDILKQLQLSGVNAKYFLKGVLCLKGKQTQDTQMTFSRI